MLNAKGPARRARRSRKIPKGGLTDTCWKIDGMPKEINHIGGKGAVRRQMNHFGESDSPVREEKKKGLSISLPMREKNTISCVNLL